VGYDLMTPDAQQPSPFNDLAYATGRWEIYRQDAGMGEKDYCVLRNGGFFCRTDDLNAAKNICAAIDKARTHTPAPDYRNVCLARNERLCETEGVSTICCTCEIVDTCADSCAFSEQHDAAIARTATLKTLDDLGTMLNSRIAKMEILDSKNPSPLRKGILMAYRDIEDWERQQRQQAGEQG